MPKPVYRPKLWMIALSLALWSLIAGVMALWLG